MKNNNFRLTTQPNLNMSNESFLSNTEGINAFINNRDIWKSLQSQIDKSLNEIKTTYDAKILELDDKIKFHDNIIKYKLWSCEEYHEDRHIPVNDFLRLLDMDMVKTSPGGHEYTSLFLSGGCGYFNGKNESGKGGWISKLSSDDYYKVAKAVCLYKKHHIYLDGGFILSGKYVEDNHHNYLYLLEQLHIKYSNKSITDERFEICRKTLLLLKEDGLLN